MTSLQTSYTKNVTNELRFLLVTPTACFDIRFGRYGILNLQFQVWDWPKLRKSQIPFR
jgi:hypothetical protein